MLFGSNFDAGDAQLKWPVERGANRHGAQLMPQTERERERERKREREIRSRGGDGDGVGQALQQSGKLIKFLRAIAKN